jgi:AcrR family transcriptional regulator
MIADAALELGLMDIKLMEVAQRLNVTLPTVYKHVKDRDALLHMTAQVLEQRYSLPANESMDWVSWWKVAAPALRTIYQQNPGLATVLMARPIGNTPPIARHWLTSQVVAEKSGFTPVMAMWANMAVFEFTYSWSAHEDQDGAAQQDNDNVPGLDAEFERECPHYGDVAEQARALPIDLRFEITLNALLSGLYSQRDALQSDLEPQAEVG